MVNPQQLEKISNGKGFIAALDQSGGSTPKALKLYGVPEDAYSGEDEMFAKVHEMRTRIIKSPAFDGDKIIGAILFEKTMDNSVDGISTATYLWEKLGIVPFLKVDKGLTEESDGVQLMKPITGLDELLDRAVKAGIFGTKMRSTINRASPSGIEAIVKQQFEVGRQIISHGLVPIIEPEVNIHAGDKAECERILKAEILKQLDALPNDHKVMLKLTLPEAGDFYSDLIDHKNVLLVVALSGGYDLDEACQRLAQNSGMVASFSRALTNGLSAGQSDEEFNSVLAATINRIYAASVEDKARTEAA